MAEDGAGVQAVREPVDGGPRVRGPWNTAVVAARFLTLADVMEILNISSPQAYALVRSGDLPAIQIGGKGVWRVEESELEAYIQRLYQEQRVRASRSAVPPDPVEDDGA